MKNEENTLSDAKIKGNDLIAGPPFGGKLSLGRAKPSMIYRQNFTAGKGTKGDDFQNA